MRRALAVAGLAVAVVGATVLPAGAGGDSSWTDLLARVPDRPVYRELVVLNDYAAAREAIDAPEPGGDANERTHQLFELVQDAGLAPVPLFTTADPETDVPAELGFRGSDIEVDAYSGVGPKALTILRGDVDADDIQDAAEADDTWSDVLTTKEHAGVEYLSWDGEKVDPRRITPVRRLGQGGRLAIDPPFLTWTTRTAPLEASLDAAAGDRPSLADDPVFSTLDETLTEAGAFAAAMGEQVEPAERDPGEPTLLPYLGFATGAGADDDGPVMYVVLVHDDPAAATENAERLQSTLTTGTAANRRPWSDLASDVSVETHGKVVVATLHVESPRLWYQVVLERDPLLVASSS